MPIGDGIYCYDGISQSNLLRLDDVGEINMFLKGLTLKPRPEEWARTGMLPTLIHFIQ